MVRSRQLSTDGPNASRRRLLGACGAALATGLAGCLLAGPPGGCGEGESPRNGFDLRTTDDTEYSVTVRVISDWIVAATTAFEETYRISSVYEEDAVRVADVVEYAGRYVVRVRLDTDPEVVAEHLWTVSPDRCDTLRIRIEAGRIDISQPGSTDLTGGNPMVGG